MVSPRLLSMAEMLLSRTAKSSTQKQTDLQLREKVNEVAMAQMAPEKYVKMSTSSPAAHWPTFAKPVPAFVFPKLWHHIFALFSPFELADSWYSTLFVL